jgi:hypothetical protein
MKKIYIRSKEKVLLLDMLEVDAILTTYWKKVYIVIQQIMVIC